MHSSSEVFISCNIFQNFTAQGNDFFIRVLPEKYVDDALDLLSEFVIPEETFCRAINIHLKPNAMKIMMEIYRDLFKQKMTLACFEKSTNKLVGLNVLGLKVLGQKKKSVSSFYLSVKFFISLIFWLFTDWYYLFKTEDPDLKVLHNSSEVTSKFYNVYNSFSVKQYLHGFGLGVRKEYRGRGIAVELLKSRKMLMEAYGIKVTFTSFSTLNSQKSAQKAGYVEVSSISFEDLQKILPEFDFSDKIGEECKSFILTQTL